ncbi:hypothetical protein GCM10019998_05540 [Tetragenococcus solitarius]|uniref:Uncharacterized protein n=1 Tax=Tetragenococcus solitarius TaxID=71453 RepID=A0ABN3Y0K3_9ENTE
MVYFSRKHENLVHEKIVELSPDKKYPRRYLEMVEKEHEMQNRPTFNTLFQEIEKRTCAFFRFS